MSIESTFNEETMAKREHAGVESAEEGTTIRPDYPNRRTAVRAALMSVPVVLTLSSSASAEDGGSEYGYAP